MFIYKTTNLINGKIYVGQQSTNNKLYLGSGKLILRAIKKYGKENFKKTIIELCESCEELNNREIYWIKALNPEYNLYPGGIGGYNEFAVIVNKKKRGKTWEEIYSPEGLIVMRNIDRIGEKNPFYGKTHSLANKQLFAKNAKKTHSGRKRSKKTCINISYGIKNSKKHKLAMQDPAVRKKISESVTKANKILWQDPEYRKRVLEGRKKCWTPKVTRDEMVNFLLKKLPATKISDELGISIPTYYKYKKIYGITKRG